MGVRYLALDKCAHAAAGVANDLDGEGIWVSGEMIGEETRQLRWIVDRWEAARTLVSRR